MTAPTAIERSSTWIGTAVAVAIAAGLSLGFGSAPAPAGASETVVTETSWSTSCGSGPFPLVGSPPRTDLSSRVTAPESVVHGDVFQIRIAPGPATFHGGSPWVTVQALEDLEVAFRSPVDARVIGADVVPGSGFGFEGTPSLVVGSAGLRAGLIVLSVPAVPADAGSSTGETTYQLPAIDLTLEATGPLGSKITTQVAGTSRETSGYSFVPRTSPPSPRSRVPCWSDAGERPPVLSESLIAAGPATVATAVDLAVEPASPFDGDEVVLEAVAGAPSGVVRFQDGPAVLGYAEVDDRGVASYLTTMEAGEHEVVAHFLGAPGYDAGSSPTVLVTVAELEATTTRLRVEPGVARTGEEVAFSVEVDAVAGAAGGAVVLRDSDGRNIGVIDLDGAGTGTYRHQLHKVGDLVVTATFLGSHGHAGSSSEGVTVTGLRWTPAFADVGEEHPFYLAVQWLSASGIAGGYTDGTFAPGGVVTRQAASTFLYRAAGSPWVGEWCQVAPFPDVPATHPLCPGIEWVWASDVARGYPDGTFRPTLPLSRQALAAFMYRAAGAPLGLDPPCASAPFSDVAIGQELCGEIAWAATTGLFEGYGDGTFRPGTDISRQAMAELLFREATS